MLYREPFGLAPVEAQLCGMPVIAWDNGAMRETIKHGETGFLVKTQQEMEDLNQPEKALAELKSLGNKYKNTAYAEKIVAAAKPIYLKSGDSVGYQNFARNLEIYQDPIIYLN